MDNFLTLRLKLKKNHKNKYLRNIDFKKFFDEKEIENIFNINKGVAIIHEILNKILIHNDKEYISNEIVYINFFFSRYLLSSYDKFINLCDFLIYNNSNLWAYLINNFEENEFILLYESIYPVCVYYKLNFDIIYKNLLNIVSIDNNSKKKVLNIYYNEKTLIQNFIDLLRIRLIDTDKNSDIYNIRLIKYMNIRVIINKELYKNVDN